MVSSGKTGSDGTGRMPWWEERHLLLGTWMQNRCLNLWEPCHHQGSVTDFPELQSKDRLPIRPWQIKLLDTAQVTLKGLAWEKNKTEGKDFSSYCYSVACLSVWCFALASPPRSRFPGTFAAELLTFGLNLLWYFCTQSPPWMKTKLDML